MEKEHDIKNVLRKSGYKATPSRLAILNVFKRVKRPLSAKGVIDALPRNTDPATVYRTINALKEKNIIKQIDLRHNHAHYELVSLEEHHHLVCTKCGRIEDVHRCWIDEMQPTILRSSKHFAEIKQHALEFYGVCKSCAKTNNASGTRTELKI